MASSSLKLSAPDGWLLLCPASVGEVVFEAAVSRADWLGSELPLFMLRVLLPVLVSCPLVLDVLQEFGIPGCVNFTTFLPVENKFSQLSLGKCTGNIGQRQHIEQRFTGLPAVRQRSRFGVLLHGVGITRPLPFNMADKAGIPGA